MYMTVEDIALHLRKAACYRERRRTLRARKHRHMVGAKLCFLFLRLV